MELFNLSALQLSHLLQSKSVSSEEVVNSYLGRIEKVEPGVKAFITLCPEEALKTAKEVDRSRAGGEDMHPLAGIPIAVKDNICTRGVRTTCASRILENFIPPYDATVVSKLRQAGLPILGKTNMDEFAMGSSTENSAFFPTRNPWDLNRVPGGSSGGSAAAVAAREAPLALGSDTGGSVRQPAALCGLNGLRPTYGRVSRYGLVAFASSLDQVGTLTVDARDGAALFRLIAGPDPCDSTSLHKPLEDDVFLDQSRETVKGLKVGIIREHMGEGFDPGIIEKVREMVLFLERQGAEVKEVSLSLAEYALPAYYLISPAEASSNLGRYDGVRYGYCYNDAHGLKEMYGFTRARGFGPEVKRRIMLGTYDLSSGYYDAYYLQALKVRTLIREELEASFKDLDILIGPTTPGPAFLLGERIDDPLQMYLSDICTLTAALAGYPSLSVFGGLLRGIPVGIQLTALPLQEALLFQVAAVLEQKESSVDLLPHLKLNGSKEEAASDL